MINNERLTPEVRDKLDKFCEIERWHRAFLTASPAAHGSIPERSWDAAFREIPLTAEETRMYREFYLQRL